MNLLWYVNGVRKYYQSIELTEELPSSTRSATIRYRKPLSETPIQALDTITVNGKPITPDTTRFGFEGTLQGWSFPVPSSLVFAGYDWEHALYGRECAIATWQAGNSSRPLFSIRFSVPQDFSGARFGGWVYLASGGPGTVRSYIASASGAARMGAPTT